MPPTPATQRVPRKVYFYRVEVLTGPDEEPQAFTAREACDCISNLSFETGARYLDLGEDGLFCVWPDATGRYMRMVLGVVRRSGLPFLEAHGDVLPLEIAEEQGILERTHAVFFPNDIVGVEYNFYGPRASRLAQYIRAKCEALPYIALAMLLNQDAAENLNNLEDIRLVHLRLRRSGLDLLRQADDNLPDALEATSEQVEAPVIEITLRGEPHSRQPLGRRALDLVRDLVGDPNIREGVDQLNVRGRDRRTGTVQPST